VTPTTTRRKRARPGVGLGIVAFLALAAVAYFTLDARVVHWVHDRRIDAATRKLDWIRKLRFIWPGHYLCTLVIAILVALFHRAGGRGAAALLLSGALTGFNSLFKWMAGRHRPDWHTGEPSMTLHPFEGGLRRLFAQENLSFPSGDAALAVATAATLALLLPRYAAIWWLGALVVAVQRVAENAHHVSDVLAAAALGLAAFHCARVACNLSREGLAGGTDSAGAIPSGPDRTLDFLPHDPMTPADSPKPYLSLVIPCYNEEENVPTLLRRVEASLLLTERPFEVILVDDGSTDSTPRLLADAMRVKPWLRVVRMAKNGGQSAAFEAGFEAARGDVIATIDADLQNDPEEIPRLLPMLDEQKVDMITGWRKDRQDTPFRRWQSRQANRIRNWISKETVNDSASSLKLYRAHAIKGLRLFNGAHRFFPTLVKMRGYTVYETPVKHSHRFAGTAKYGFRNRALRAFIDLIGIRWMKERYLRYQATEVRADRDGI
jgi:membrane-associated phospholipid phosphatase